MQGVEYLARGDALSEDEIRLSFWLDAELFSGFDIEDPRDSPISEGRQFIMSFLEGTWAILV